MGLGLVIYGTGNPKLKTRVKAERQQQGRAGPEEGCRPKPHSQPGG